MSENLNEDYREDRVCSNCGKAGAKLYSVDVNSFPLWLCKDCLSKRTNNRQNQKRIALELSRRWGGIGVESRVLVCEDCGTLRLEVVSLDGTCYYSSCDCGVEESISSVKGLFSFKHGD